MVHCLTTKQQELFWAVVGREAILIILKSAIDVTLYGTQGGGSVHSVTKVCLQPVIHI